MYHAACYLHAAKGPYGTPVHVWPMRAVTLKHEKERAAEAGILESEDGLCATADVARVMPQRRTGIPLEQLPRNRVLVLQMLADASMLHTSTKRGR